MAGESRHSLLQWINDLCQVQYTKVEQCGNGAVYCHVIDSIFLDVPVHKIKLNAKQSYELMANYKILQNAFKDHQIDKVVTNHLGGTVAQTLTLLAQPVPVEKLMNCKMQDNLEFLQWLKKFWDMNFPGGEYDALARRGGTGAGSARSGSSAGVRPAGRSPVTTTSAPPARAGAAATTASRRSGPAAGSARTGSGVGVRPSNASSSNNDAAVQQLTSQMEEMRVSVDGLEKERDFYFNKLREIEILIGARLETEDETMTETEKNLLLEIQQILYSTEEGFEVPDVEEEDGLQHEDDLETF
ncbi:microtubule integrity protein mal3 [Microbotryomycetes sp. JL201]|nr:microtubule integrity protein mal3 [Microbotryomycetes sp. JL201]